MRVARSAAIIAAVTAASAYIFYATAGHHGSTAAIGEAATTIVGFQLGLVIGAAVIGSIAGIGTAIAAGSVVCIAFIQAAALFAGGSGSSGRRVAVGFFIFIFADIAVVVGALLGAAIGGDWFRGEKPKRD